MSLGVSQIPFWLPSSKEKQTDANQASNSKKGEEQGGTFLSYGVFMGLTILGGFFALDHLYLRSPLTFLAKLIINILFFGVWWLYDASQAVFNDDVVKIFGLGVPGFGPKGIAAGVLAKDVPDKKHMSFFVYALALILGGIFGLDSFLIGNKQTGIIRLVSLLTGIFAPIAIGWWLYKLFKFFFDTKSVIEQNYEYFGAPAPVSQAMMVAEKLKESIPILGKLIGPINKVKDVVVKTVEKAESFVETAKNDAESFVEVVTENPGALINSVVKGPVEKVASFAEPIIKPITNTAQMAIKPITNTAQMAIKPITNTAQMALQTVDDVAGTARESIALGKNALNRGSTIVQSAINTVGKTAEAATGALQLAPMAASLTDGLTPSAIQKAKIAAQTGGGSSDMLSYALVGTVGLIIVSGLVLTYRRLRQNEQPRKDDSPPEPGVLRKSDQEKST